MATKPQLRSHTKKYRVLLVDDHPIVRQGLALLIDRETDLAVCGEADGAHSAFHAITTLRPDIVVLDISLSGPDGLDVLKEIRSKTREPAGSDSVHARRIHLCGARHARRRQRLHHEAGGHRESAGGHPTNSAGRSLSERPADQLDAAAICARNRAAEEVLRSSNLTDRELEVFRLIGEGHGTRQIADELHLSVKTIESYQAHIKEKLALRNARELVQHAIEWT